MKSEKQKLLLEYLFSNPDLWARCSHIVKSEYWDPTYRDAIEFVQSYNQEYHTLPEPDKIQAESGIEIEPKEVNKASLDYCSDEIERHCKNQAMVSALRKGSKVVKSEDYGQIEQLFRDAITVSLHRDIGLDYFEDPEKRLREMKNRRNMIKTAWPNVDYALFGGLNRRELTIFAGESGAGKSMTLLNLGRNLASQRYNGIYFSLELSEELIARRLDSMMSGIGQQEIMSQIDRVSMSILTQKHEFGKFLFKEFPATTTTVNTLRAHLKELELSQGWIPDFIIIDYLDLMAPTANMDLGNLFVKDKFVSEEMRNLGKEYDAVMISASQLNRTAIDQERHHQGMIAGGISKINTADNVITLKQTDHMRAVGEIMFQFIKTRSSNAVGKTLFLDWDPQNLLIRDILEGGKSKRNDDGPGKSGTTQATTPNLSSEKANQLKNLLGRFGDS
jgi:KaiC/GvpD/RAD55 family RecA-like ATPase